VSTVYVGAVAPEYLSVEVLTADDFDLSTVTSATMVVRYPGPALILRSWACTLSGQTSASLTATHLYATGDIETEGTYTVYVSMTAPSGTVRSLPKTFTARHLL
jgi:hypothetical protein